MILTELNIHDSQILKVIEDSQNDTLDFVLDYPIDYENNNFERRNLRFYDFLNYQINEIPLSGLPTILEIKDLRIINYTVGTGRNKIEIVRHHVEFLTNCGSRVLEYKTFELLTVDCD